jgi:hypothetical protein
MTKHLHLGVATLTLVGVLGLSAGAYAVVPGQTTDQAASSTGNQAGNQPAATEVGKSTGCSTTGGAMPKSGTWTGEQNKANPTQANAAGCSEMGPQQQK